MDECQRERSPCGRRAVCVNTPGSFTCQCRGGGNRIWSAEARRCKKVNPCRTNSTLCGEGGKCHMIRGGYTCQCSDGYAKAEDGKSCVAKSGCEMVRE